MSVVLTLNRAPDSRLDISTGIRTSTREFRRRSFFINALAARKLDLARSTETGLYRTKLAPTSNAERMPLPGSRIATATVRLLHGDVRAHPRPSPPPEPPQSTTIPSTPPPLTFR